MLRALFNLVRGVLVGITEIIPGVSGGTIALIIGIYETVISSAGELVRGVARFCSAILRRGSTEAARAHFSRVRWGVLLPVGIGMLAGILIGAALVAPLVSDYPMHTRAVFAGLIFASILVPARMVGERWRARDFGYAAVAALVSFIVTGIPAGSSMTEPPLLLVAVAAAIAVCALVLPGVSGSFFLLLMGLYAPTLAAVNERNFLYLGVFILGALIGFASFVSLLEWLLEHRRRITLVIMTGLMAGSLRALWPWLAEDGGLEAPGSDWPVMLALFAAGVAVIALLLLLEARRAKAQAVARDSTDESTDETAKH